ncbi:MAG: ComF family protein [Candidatus Omnitrophica bacterium]|nr:ComF family protein [Candidatus Omnitrophota bacterium]
MSVKQLLDSCINVIFYSACPLCGREPIKHPLPICRPCEESILQARVPGPVFLQGGLRILSCRVYDGSVKESIKYFKYRHAGNMMRSFERAFDDFTKRNMDSFLDKDLIVSVPMYPARQRKRTFNQSEVLAKILSGMLSIQSSSYNLIKTKDTLHQAELGRRERLSNLKGSFFVTRSELFRDKNILLVDDVMTTGATLEACMPEIVGAGARSVSGLTLARTM